MDSYTLNLLKKNRHIYILFIPKGAQHDQNPTNQARYAALLRSNGAVRAAGERTQKESLETKVGERTQKESLEIKVGERTQKESLYTKVWRKRVWRPRCGE